MSIKRYIVPMMVEIDLDDAQDSTLEDVEDVLAARLTAFPYPAGVRVVSAKLLPAASQVGIPIGYWRSEYRQDPNPCVDTSCLNRE